MSEVERFTSNEQHSFRTVRESRKSKEHISALTHFIAAILAAVGLVFLVYKSSYPIKKTFAHRNLPSLWGRNDLAVYRQHLVPLVNFIREGN
jgi:hypothetical protein